MPAARNESKRAVLEGVAGRDVSLKKPRRVNWEMLAIREWQMSLPKRPVAPTTRMEGRVSVRGVGVAIVEVRAKDME
jgi:hypothetical protein